MSKKKSHTKKLNTPKKYRVKNALVNYYLVLMFTAFPLFFTQQFAKIRHDKLYFFLALSVILIFIELVIMLCDIGGRRGASQLERWYQKLDFTDYAFFALILCFTVSTLLSSYKADSFSGTQGRNNGLLLYIIYFLVYIIISRLYYYKEYVFPLMAAGCLIVYILCILNYFYIDPLGMFKGYSETVAADFTSTIGNKNIMSCFCCITIPVFITLFIHTENKLRYLYLAAAGVGFASILCADSESGFLGLVPLLAILLVYYIRNIKRLADFFLSVTVMLACAKLLRLFSFFLKDSDKGFGTMQTLFIYNNKTFIVLFLFLAVTAALLLLDKKRPGLILPRWSFYAVLGVYAVLLASLFTAFVYFTFIDTQTELSSLLSYLRFNEKWGTHRGYMWIKSWEIFKTSGVKNILFGWGPDTFYSAFSPYFQELNTLFGDSSTNCAHNEFLNYLITGGVLGLGAYIALFASAIAGAFKSSKNNPLSIVFISGVICYLFQSIVNIATPITTPLLFVLLALSRAVCRNSKTAEA